MAESTEYALTYDLEITSSQKKNILTNFQHVFNGYIADFDRKYMKWCIDICPELLNQINDEGITPLMWAIQKKALAFAHDLIEKGADQHIVTEGGYTAIHYAAECLPSLLEPLDYTDYLSPEKRVDEGKHLVHLICSGDGEEETRLKIISEASHLIDIQDDFGKTPLVYAAIAEQLTLAQHLISMGAKLDVRINKPESSEHGVTLINLLRAERGQDRSSDKKLSKIIDLLIEAGAPNEGLHRRSLPMNAPPLSILNTPESDEEIMVEGKVENADADKDTMGWDW